VSFEDFQSSSTPEPEPAPAPEPEATSPWDEQPAFGGETRAFPRMSYDELQQVASSPAPAPGPESEAAPEPEATSPWDEQPAFGGETRAFPRVSYDELQQMASTPAAAPEPEPEPEPAPEPESLWDEPAAPSWSAEPEPAVESVNNFAAETSSPFASALQDEPVSDSPLFGAGEETPAEEPEAIESAPAEEPEWAKPALVAELAAEEPAAAAPLTGTGAGELTDEQIDRIARRVVQLMSDQIVRNIAWEVIPDLAEIVVKERIRQLENE
jgi:hypothetical protein